MAAARHLHVGDVAVRVEGNLQADFAFLVRAHGFVGIGRLDALDELRFQIAR